MKWRKNSAVTIESCGTIIFLYFVGMFFVISK